MRLNQRIFTEWNHVDCISKSVFYIRTTKPIGLKEYLTTLYFSGYWLVGNEPEAGTLSPGQEINTSEPPSTPSSLLSTDSSKSEAVMAEKYDIDDLFSS